MNPVLVEVLRGGFVESRHHGAFVITDTQGKVVESQGDINAAVFPRSAIKALQALPLLESGAAEKLTNEELALCISSHGGEPEHVRVAQSILSKSSRDETCLECGAHQPMFQKAALKLARNKQAPSPLHNNCSGKHAGFICLATHLGIDHKGYVKQDHAIQKLITAKIENFCGVSLTNAPCGTDGCSIPTFAYPLKNMAHGFAKLIDHKPAERLFKAAVEHPFMVAGTGRFCTNVMKILGEQAFVKTGAEGVFCAALPSQGFGIAIKCNDGAARAAEVILSAILKKYLGDNDKMQAFYNPKQTNWNGIEVGSLRATF